MVFVGLKGETEEVFHELQNHMYLASGGRWRVSRKEDGFFSGIPMGAMSRDAVLGRDTILKE